MTTASWYLDEFAHVGQEHLDSAYVASYDQKAETDWAGEITILRDLGLSDAHTLVDLGAGTGAFALAVAPFCRRVVAVDVSPPMLASLHERATRLQVDNIVPIEAGLLTYAHLGDPADFVYSRHALHHLPDFWKALALGKIATMMRAGGVFRLRDLIFSCELGDTSRTIEAWLAGADSRSGAGWTRQELELHLREEHSTFSWLLEPMLERAGFTIESAVYSNSRIYAEYICTKK